jgi:uncharacterized protein (TIGR04255 family)
MDKLPIKIEKDLISEAIFELKFSTNIPSGAVFGVIYKVIANKYSNVPNIALPILEIPETIRNSDPNLRYQAYNRLKIDNYNISIGPRVINFSVQKPYIGWTQWRTFINNILNDLINSDIFNIIESSGLRYINAIKDNVFSLINVNIEISEKKLSEQPTILRTEIKDEKYISVLQIANSALIKNNVDKFDGSVIDIDVLRKLEMNNSDFKDEYMNILDEAHTKEKELFFKILKKDFLQSLKPVY